MFKIHSSKLIGQGVYNVFGISRSLAFFFSLSLSKPPAFGIWETAAQLFPGTPAQAGKTAYPVITSPNRVLCLRWVISNFLLQ